jgi:DNA-binding transcriptional regulator YhcF (GntR family)
MITPQLNKKHRDKVINTMAKTIQDLIYLGLDKYDIHKLFHESLTGKNKRSEK